MISSTHHLYLCYLQVKLGALDATVETMMASRYQVQGYPTIKMFAAGKKTSDSVEDYNGGRTSSDIVSWALDKVAENVPAPEIIQVRYLLFISLAIKYSDGLKSKYLIIFFENIF